MFEKTTTVSDAETVRLNSCGVHAAKIIGCSSKQDVHDLTGFTISSWASFTKFIVPLYQQAFLIMIIVYVNYEIK
ncbi:MAG TPA: hypothetical protein PK248_04335 [Treponemataceae bacterium]|nr:hypothetical protein [Treponemataceae bacterium]